MTDNTTVHFDLAELIAAALALTGEPSYNAARPDAVRRETDIHLGVVPLHLRHLVALLPKVAYGESRIINDLFWAALKPYLMKPDVKLYKKKLLSDWTVVGVPDDGRPRAQPIGGMMIIISGRAPAEGLSMDALDSIFGAHRY